MVDFMCQCGGAMVARYSVKKILDAPGKVFLDEINT